MSDSAVRETVIVKEFGPEMAGTRVGWSAIYDEGMLDGWSSVNIAAGTVGPEGASVSYELRERDGEPLILRSTDSTKGFIALNGMSLGIDRNEPASAQEHNAFRSLRAKDTSNHIHPDVIMTQAGEDHHRLERVQAKAKWTDSMPELIQDVKRAMKDEDLEEYYPLAYYTANVAFVHGLRLELPETVAPRDVLVPDPDMQTETLDQIQVAKALESGLVRQILENKKMKGELNPFNALNPADIPHKFEASRRVMHELEESVVVADDQLHTRVGLYLPTGFNSGGREWPYMNAAEKDENHAFGLELDALNEGNVDPANRELRRELTELEKRDEYAQHGYASLRLLHTVEGSL